ncbi:MAG TPA: ATPase, T2SS/T4P/T4SS family [Chloroflexia bacterium]|nr:ATPase, T2SS/T4P/T4SS family [Chloroflexia bacterium]
MSSLLRRLADNSNPQGGQQNGHAPQAPVPPGPFPNSVATPPPAPDYTPRPQTGAATAALTNTLPPQPPGVTDALPPQQQAQGNPTSHLGPSPTPQPPLTQVPPQLVNSLVQRILSGFPQNATLDKTPEMEQMLAGRFMAALSQVSSNIPPGGQEALFSAVMDEILGFGPLEPLLKDDSISEIMVNGPDQVWIERKGNLVESGITFMNDDHVMRIAQRIVAPLGRRIDRKWPMVDARLPDGSRVNIIAQPCAIQGTTITIRKFFKSPLTVKNLVQFGTITPQMADFLQACVVGRLNVVVSGGTGSGKTTLLNVLSSFIPEGERIVTIEDSAELRLNQRHVVSLEARPADVDNSGAVTIRHLVTNALRMRPERIVVGECRGGEALDMLQAMNTGHDGSLTTLHANTPRDALTRMETMVLMSGMDLPVKVIREQVAAAIDLIVQQARLRDGSRKVTYITEVQGMEGDTIVLQDIFRFKETGTDANGKVVGKIQASGLIPKFISRLEAHGQRIDRSLFKQEF